MIATYIVYIFFLGLFIILSALIFRYTVKYSYLSPRFKYIFGTFLVLSALLVITSFYWLMRLNSN